MIIRTEVVYSISMGQREDNTIGYTFFYVVKFLNNFLYTIHTYIMGDTVMVHFFNNSKGEQSVDTLTTDRNG